MNDYKNLIRFKPAEAVEKAKISIKNLRTKYEAEIIDEGKAEEILVDAHEYRWASKAARMFILGEDLVCNHLIPCGESILKRAKEH